MLGSEDAYFEFSGTALDEAQNIKSDADTTDNNAALTATPDGTVPVIHSTDDTLYEVNSPSGSAGFSYETDPVQKQFATVEGIEYPCVYIQSEPADLQKHRLNTLAVLAKSDADELKYPLYLEVGSNVSGLGTIDSHSLKTVLTSSLFAPWKIYIRVSKEQFYDDDMRLAFCS